MTEDKVFGWAVEEGLLEPEVQERLAAGSVTEQDLRDAARTARPSIVAAARDQQHIAEATKDAGAMVRIRGGPWRAGLVTAIPLPMWWSLILVSPLSPTWKLGAAIAVSLLCLAMVVLPQRWPGGMKIVHGWIIAAVLVPSWGSLLLAILQPFAWRRYLVVAAVFGLGLLLAKQVRPSPTERFFIGGFGDAERFWQHAMLRNGVLPVYRAEINRTDITHSTVLPSTAAGGVFGSLPLSAHQRTPAGMRLAELVASVTGGSFALAGPRGSGKTNLLHAFCAGTYAKADQSTDLTVIAAAPVEYVSREFLLHLYAETCRAVLARGGSQELAKAARAGLDAIAYVQTISREHGGKFGFRGADYSFKRGISLAGRPPTYPEVVNDFREFVRSAAKSLAPSRVLIAIDEIDRIGTGESARRFLNELKAIFDVPGCFYLISVSTEAQHDFELSGIGLRSVFDSSFDEVVRVDYLDFDLARRLLRRLVVGLPEQFAALAYVFSGGLARQLVRAVRDVLRQGEGATLSEVAHALTQDELVRVCLTTGDALTALDDRRGVTKLLRALMERPDDLRTYAQRLRASYDGESASVRDLNDLAAARIMFLAVVREVFTDDLDEVLPDRFDALARARRYAGSNPVTGLELLEELSPGRRARPAPGRPPR